ncbi:hypothetical protein BV898_07663 [Hypsibius exemplaris]|uniref:Uncharacterized protein n=1 Tax=Hypsibius exemplaris TaxID=2072580 RepID=A0A1W0WSW5_HYPEX|nr:hypothetical protein BV898_07663 [Hypsibius exemplaris]
MSASAYHTDLLGRGNPSSFRKEIRTRRTQGASLPLLRPQQERSIPRFMPGYQYQRVTRFHHRHSVYPPWSVGHRKELAQLRTTTSERPPSTAAEGSPWYCPC